jgi:hypothetical protein
VVSSVPIVCRGDFAKPLENTGLLALRIRYDPASAMIDLLMLGCYRFDTTLIGHPSKISIDFVLGAPAED